MTDIEFINKYCGSRRLLQYHQRTIDLLSDIEDIFDDETLTLPGSAVLAAQYQVENELEVMDKELPDYKFLQKVSRALENLTEK